MTANFMKHLFIIAIIIPLCGCFAGIRTKTNYHMASIPPSVARDLRQQCQMSGMWKNLVGGLLEYEQHMRKVAEDKVRDLEMDNAALKAIVGHLNEQVAAGQPAASFGQGTYGYAATSTDRPNIATPPPARGAR